MSVRGETVDAGAGGETAARRLERQLAFVLELDRLKHVLRRSWLLDGSRLENAAEHSWHVALMALVLAEHAREPLDPAHLAKMLLVHDVIEIDAGDTYIYDRDPAAHAGKDEREARAARRLFGLLPDDQRRELHALWEEYEAQSSPEARFAKSVDRLMPFLHNVHTDGRSWREHGVSATDVAPAIAQIEPGSSALYALARDLLARAVDAGHLPSAAADGAAEPVPDHLNTNTTAKTGGSRS